jgi:hypothetical protein
VSYAHDLFAGLLAHRHIDGDDENNAIVDALALALGDVFEPLVLLAFGDESQGIAGMGRVLRDPAVAPLWALPHAALYVGARLPGRKAGESDQEYTARARDAAVYPFGLHRGTHEAIRRAINPYLTGNKTVFISDNYGGPYELYVRTLTEETPDPAMVERVLAGGFVSGSDPGAIRAELVLTYEAADYAAWLEATRRWSELGAGLQWSNVTREDLT